MGAFKYMRENEKKMLKDRSLRRQLLSEVRHVPMIVRVKRPTKLSKAKTIGYKAKPGFVVLRVRIGKGSFRRPRPVHARKPSKTGIYFNLKKSKQRIAEERALKVYKNMKLAGSYYLIEDGQYTWYEILLMDPVLAPLKKQARKG